MQHFPGGSFVKLGSAMSLLTGKRMKISYLQAKCSRMTFKLDAHAHFAAGVGSTDIQETPLDPPSRRRRTKTNKEVAGGYGELKPLTPEVLAIGLQDALPLPGHRRLLPTATRLAKLWRCRQSRGKSGVGHARRPGCSGAGGSIPDAAILANLLKHTQRS